MSDIPDDVRELLRDAWTLISRQRGRDSKVIDWRDRMRARLNHVADDFGDKPDADDVP